ncbi:cobyric acid synthase [Haloplanus aerogenes]|uniref:Probable cobyric acid synthase n=1 Tax=Haloplanus aerogenes TaxID=660522 RepID=A0A3M0DPW4_9EURY|nr:cobyric acid synthase [Haloplanus aerogenes]AZH24573.1 cobyric acid synthase [Haloplanus aerogenes]RMB23772.1 adenosylcobyric acid synthase (glutamine-hydrolysing) [Haloplanus aerogenes]
MSDDARTLLVAGTASHVGKSTVAAGLCRRLADAGYDVAPFKAQNMSNNARAVPRASGAGFGEIGVSQYVQARAASVRPTTDHNPVLLKPRGDGESQLVIDGEAETTVAAGRYYDEWWTRAREAVVAAHDRLAADADVVVAEGAGSIAEINLHDRDLANVETARIADADILLTADVERGGVFAAIVGTLDLLPDDLRDRVVGVVITKFRGDRTLLDDGIEAVEARTGVPILAVLPYDDPGLPEEDSVALPARGERRMVGADDGVVPERTVTVAVPRLPRVSNATDLEPLARVPGVRVVYVPLDAEFDRVGPDDRPADAVVLPGTKNTVDDLLAAREAGLGDCLRAVDGPVVGLCGGYQFLGERIEGAAREGTGDRGTVPGLGLLPVATRFSTDKRVEPATWTVEGGGPLAGATGTVEGYEIHAGETRATGAVRTPFAAPDGRTGPELGAARGSVLGTYLHDLFANRVAREAFVEAVYDAAGRERPGATADDVSPYDRAAALVEPIDLDALGLPDRPNV